MDVFNTTERLMGMTNDTWARHANPWSVYSRFTALPLLSFAIWSRTWWGWWALAAVAIVILWIWLNPRLFSAPKHTNTWAARGTFGERVYLNRKTIPIPAHYTRWGTGLTLASGIGLIPFIWGLLQFNLAWLLLGMALLVGAKTWFVDRMTFLYDEMQSADPEYQSWMR